MAVYVTTSSDIESKQLSRTSTSFNENGVACAFYAANKKCLVFNLPEHVLQ